MISIGGGAALIVLAVVTLICSDSMWARIAAGFYVALYVVAVAWLFIDTGHDLAALAGPAILLAFAWYAVSVVKGYGKDY